MKIRKLRLCRGVWGWERKGLQKDLVKPASYLGPYDMIAIAP